MKVAVVGSRTFYDYKFLCSIMDDVDAKISGGITLIVSGGANGADKLGEKYALSRKIPTKIFRADWNKFGKSAGYRRNIDIVNESEVIVAFWDGESKGTKHTVETANSKGKRVIIKWNPS